MGADRQAIIAQLRDAIGAVESKSDGRPPTLPPRPQPTPPRATPAVLKGWDVPDGDDWRDHLPARYVDGQHGFDHRLMEDLAAVGVRCYTIGHFKATTAPSAIPVFVDWLTHLEARIPGEETHHRNIIRIGLIWNLHDRAAQGKQHIVDLMLTQIRHQPPLTRGAQDAALSTLSFVATARHFAQIVELLAEPIDMAGRSWLVSYLGKVKTDEARALAVGYLDSPYTAFALKALIQMKAAGVRDLVAPYVGSEHAEVRKYARRAMERLA
ncbi:HEAT repeat domain-containing protein [Mycolicibacterium sp. XJ775]